MQSDSTTTVRDDSNDSDSDTLVRGDTFVQGVQNGPDGDVFTLREYVFESRHEQRMVPRHWMSAENPYDLAEWQ